MTTTTVTMTAERTSADGIAARDVATRAGPPDTGRPAGPPRAADLTSPPAPGRPRWVASARLRIVGWQLLLVLVALAASVTLTHQILLTRLDERIDRELTQEIDELRALAGTGVNPETGGPFTDARQILLVNLARNIPDRNETMLALVNGVPDARSAQEPALRLDTNPAAVAEFAAVDTATLGNLTSRAGTVRYAAAVVTVEGSPDRGTFVVAIFRDLERREVDEVTRILALVGFLALVLAAAAGWLIAGRTLAPVRLVRTTAQQITDTDLTRRIPVQGHDDIAELARTFNSMLDRLATAFDTQRRFIDDAGHELRTPITIVRGHLELIPDDPTEQAETIELVTDELDRMNRMVDDLLVLAKAGRPDFLRPEPTDLAVLTDEVFAKATALAPRTWSVESRAPGTVLLDRHRITQALLQLAQNATQHTTDTDTITIGTRRHHDRVELWVRDTGPGVAAEDREHIFERFARATAARRRSEGAGLGLAIVRAIATAHGGDITLDNPPAGGAQFRITLPAGPTRRPAPHPRTDPPRSAP